MLNMVHILGAMRMPFTVSNIVYFSKLHQIFTYFSHFVVVAFVLLIKLRSKFSSNPIKKNFFFVVLFPERIFQVGKYLELRFEFRTSEMQGVILSVTEPVNFPAISIELHKGKVMYLKSVC